MKTIILLSAFLVYLVFLIIISSILEKTIKVSSRKNVKFTKLILPSTLVMVTWGTLSYMYVVTLTKLNVDLPTYFINSFLKLPTPFSNLTLILGVLGIYILIAICLQSLFVYLINYNITKPFKKVYTKVAMFFAEKINKNQKLVAFFANVKEKIFKKEKEEEKEKEKEEDVKIDLLTCFFSSILTFIFIIAFIGIFIFISKFLSNKILNILIEK